MGKDKSARRSSEPSDEQEIHNNSSSAEKEATWEEMVSKVSVIAKPLASKKLTRRLFKVIKKAQKHKQLRKGVKEVQKFIRKGETGIVVLAGDTNPLEVICHMPVVCEEADLPYCYAPSKQEMGLACGSKRPTCMVLIKPHQDYKELFDTCFEDVKSLPMPL